MSFQKEFNKNMKYGVLAIGIMLIAMAGFYFNAVQDDFDGSCNQCTTQYCQDNDAVCGDFGVYYFKFFSLITMGMFGVGMIIIPKGEKQ